VKAVLERMGAGQPQVSSVDMEVTFVVNPGTVRPLSLPTDTSEQLRDAFNKMAGTAEVDVPDAAPTLLRPEGADGPISMPILLTKEPADELDTLRLRMSRVEAEVAQVQAEAAAPPPAAAPSTPPTASKPPLSLDIDQDELDAVIAEADAKAAQGARRNTIIAMLVVVMVAVAVLASIYLGGR
jgi:hypothetical protein